jgi:hypothetical protein
MAEMLGRRECLGDMRGINGSLPRPACATGSSSWFVTASDPKRLNAEQLGLEVFRLDRIDLDRGGELARKDHRWFRAFGAADMTGFPVLGWGLVPMYGPRAMCSMSQ